MMLKKTLAKLFNYDVQKIELPINLLRSDFEELGKEAIFEYGITLNKTGINNKYYFGLYSFFTEPTQHCYCTKNDLFYILGMVKYVKDIQGKSFSTFYSGKEENAYNYAVQKEYEHIKQVYKELFKEEWKGNKDYKILYNKIEEETDYVGNYFEYYREYIYYMTFYELLLGIKKDTEI